MKIALSSYAVCLVALLTVLCKCGSVCPVLKHGPRSPTHVRANDILMSQTYAKAKLAVWLMMEDLVLMI
jgi:hypothetical protein